MKKHEGIEIRHARDCATHAAGACKCSPSYRAWAWSKRDDRKIRRTFPTLAAAKSWRTDALHSLKRGSLRAATPETVRAAGEKLIAGIQSGSIRDRSGKAYKPSTVRSYEASLEKHVYPAFAARKLSSVIYPDLQDFVDELAAQGLDGSTIRNTVNPLRVIFRRARYQIPVNPTTGLEIVARREKQRRVVTAAMAAKMIEAVPLEERALRAAAFYGGLRNGELQALQIEDVELYPEGRWGLIHVRHGWDKFEGAQDPKSKAGKRTVPVCEQLYEILDEHLLRIDRASGLIFGRNAETPFSYSGVRARAERASAKAGLEPSDLQLHECRHNYRSLLAAAGVPRDRRDRYTGHSDPSVGGRYEHQLEHSYLDDAEAFSDYLRRADTPTRAGQVWASEGHSPTVPSLPERDSDAVTVQPSVEPEPLQ